jgi:hypothetical protein
MNRVRASVVVCCLASLVALPSASVASPTQAAPSRPLVTAISDPIAFSGAKGYVALARSRGAGAAVAKIVLYWDQVAPAGRERPAGFDANNPADPAYRWDAFDALVKTTVKQNLRPLVLISNAPTWATRPPQGRNEPNWNIEPRALADFAEAAARRFSGTFRGLPRVRYWQVWNEPNLSSFFNPQLSNQLTQTPRCPFPPGKVVSADLYRKMVNATAQTLHRVRPDNVVIAGGLSPFCGTRGVVATAPLLFMRKLLCMSRGPVPKPTCNATVEFDVWGVHPYTAGGPTHSAFKPDDVSIGDLPEVRRLLRAAVSAGHVASRRSVRLWVTEFGWDTRPRDYYAVPLKLHARWVAEALYRMWGDGVTLVTWFAIRDDARRGREDGQIIQSGLYFRGRSIAHDRAKRSLTAFRFPFVAFRTGEKIRVWGRTPWGRPGNVVIERSVQSGWKRVARLQVDRYGVFRRTVPDTGIGDLLRARLPNGSRISVPFSLTRPPELLVNPFGGPHQAVP